MKREYNIQGIQGIQAKQGLQAKEDLQRMQEGKAKGNSKSTKTKVTG